MASIAPWSIGSRGIAALAALSLVLSGELAAAGVSTSTQIASYRVSGATASDLISFMRYHPFHGDSGGAVANIRPSYALSVATKQSGSVCRASAVNLKVSFVMTLPSATNAGAMSPATRAAWNSFVAFARRHEEHHRAIYVQCANSFVAKAERLTASTCLGLNANVRSLLETQKRACDRLQLAFDRVDAPRVTGLTLFAMAGVPGRKLAKAKRPVGPAKVIQVSAPGTGLIGPR
jgi:predicted secreted Zn-dependent protease